MMLGLPRNCLAAIAGFLTPEERCILSMSSKDLREVCCSDRTVDGVACLNAWGFAVCRALGCPLIPEVCDVLSAAGSARDADLVIAADAGCPVGKKVAAEAVLRGDIEMVVWAWRRGAPLDADVARRSALAPPHVVRWLALQGCPVRLALTDMVIADNAESVEAISDTEDVGIGVWMRLMRIAKESGSHKTLRFIARAKRLHW